MVPSPARVLALGVAAAGAALVWVNRVEADESRLLGAGVLLVALAALLTRETPRRTRVLEASRRCCWCWRGASARCGARTRSRPAPTPSARCTSSTTPSCATRCSPGARAARARRINAACSTSHADPRPGGGAACGLGRRGLFAASRQRLRRARAGVASGPRGPADRGAELLGARIQHAAAGAGARSSRPPRSHRKTCRRGVVCGERSVPRPGDLAPSPWQAQVPAPALRRPAGRGLAPAEQIDPLGGQLTRLYENPRAWDGVVVAGFDRIRAAAATRDLPVAVAVFPLFIEHPLPEYLAIYPKVVKEAERHGFMGSTSRRRHSTTSRWRRW